MRYPYLALLTLASLYAQEGIVPVEKFSGDPYVEKTKRNLAEGEAPQFYRVQEGDTLFDICSQLIDEPDYWPKLWALNPDIKNPHFIYPGMLIRFYPGDTQRPPFLEVVAEEDVVPFSETELDEVLVDYSTLFPTQGTDSQFALVKESELHFSASDLEELGTLYNPKEKEVVVPAFYYQQDPEVFGMAMQGTWGQRSAAQGHRVWFQESQSQKLQNAQNKIMSVLRPTSPESNSVRRFEFIAHVKVLKTHNSHALVHIIRSRLAVQPGDILVDFRSVIRRYDPTSVGISSSQQARLIGMEYVNQNLGGTGALVVVDSILPASTLMPVYSETYRQMDPALAQLVDDASNPVGYVKIISEIGQASLGIVMSSESDIRIGDYVGKRF